MKIVLVNKYWYMRGGSERVVFLTKKLLEASGHQVEIFGMKHKKNIFQNKYFIENIDYSQMSGFKKFLGARKFLHNSETKEKFKQLLQDFRPDVVHFHNIYHQLSFSLVEAAEECGIPSVMTLHDCKMLSPNYNMFHHGAIDESCVGGKYYRCLLKNCMESVGESFLVTLEAYYRRSKKYKEKINYFISPSVFLKNLCLKAGWSRSNISVVPNPIEKVHTACVEGKYVAYAGRLSQEKGVDVLIHAAKQTPDIPYKIAGTGPEEHGLKHLVQSLGIKNVSFEGWLTGKSLESFLQNAKLFVVPSLWYENYPYSILEAKQSGKIVIASDIGGIPEILNQNFLFAPGDPNALAQRVKKWYSTPFKELKTIGEQMRSEVENNNSPALYLKSIVDIYTQIKE